MKYVILFTVSFLSFFNLSAMDETNLMILESTNNEKISFFQEPTNVKLNLQYVNIIVRSDRKSFQLNKVVDRGQVFNPQHDRIDITLKDLLILKDNPSLNRIDLNGVIYGINEITLEKGDVKPDSFEEPKEKLLYFGVQNLPYKLFATGAFLICFIVLLRYLNCRTLYKVIG